jgi:hypothetical protein
MPKPRVILLRFLQLCCQNQGTVAVLPSAFTIYVRLSCYHALSPARSANDVSQSNIEEYQKTPLLDSVMVEKLND